MKQIVLAVLFCGIASGCATSPKFISELESVPTWFAAQIPNAAERGYPESGAAPQKPDDLQPLTAWEDQLAVLKAEGQEIAEIANSKMPSITPDTDTFVRVNSALADVDKFNQAEADAEDAAAAAKTSQ